MKKIKNENKNYYNTLQKDFNQSLKQGRIENVLMLQGHLP